jgi:hypothetical protein
LVGGKSRMSVWSVFVSKARDVLEGRHSFFESIQYSLMPLNSMRDIVVEFVLW